MIDVSQSIAKDSKKKQKECAFVPKILDRFQIVQAQKLFTISSRWRSLAKWFREHSWLDAVKNLRSLPHLSLIQCMHSILNVIFYFFLQKDVRYYNDDAPDSLHLVQTPRPLVWTQIFDEPEAYFSLAHSITHSLFFSIVSYSWQF